MERFGEGRESGEMPPKKISDLLWPQKKRGRTGATQNSSSRDQPTTRQLEEQVSTIVLTGDPHGTFWICSILSPLFKDELNASKDDPKSDTSTCAREIEETVQLFIHRQAVGRRLCFVILVGHLCHLLAEEYGNIVKHLDMVLDISVSLQLTGFLVSPIIAI